jgi:GTP-binding protein
MEHCLKGVEEEVPFIKYCPKLCISATTTRNTEQILPLVKEVHEASKQRISTPQLNKVIEKAMQAVHPPMIDGKRLRIYYMTQVDIQPPTFILFVNYPFLMIDSYKKYLYNQFRETFPFTGVPLQMFLKGKRREKGEHRPEEGSTPAYPRSAPPEEEEESIAIRGDDLGDEEEVFDDVDDDVWK